MQTLSAGLSSIAAKLAPGSSEQQAAAGGVLPAGMDTSHGIVCADWGASMLRLFLLSNEGKLLDSSVALACLHGSLRDTPALCPATG